VAPTTLTGDGNVGHRTLSGGAGAGKPSPAEGDGAREATRRTLLWGVIDGLSLVLVQGYQLVTTASSGPGGHRAKGINDAFV